jgi:hypothetical protein
MLDGKDQKSAELKSIETTEIRKAIHNAAKGFAMRRLNSKS